MELISVEYQAMLDWLHSSQFTQLCSYLNCNEDITRKRLMNTLHNPKEARRIANLYDIRIHLLQAVLAAFCLCLCATNSANALPLLQSTPAAVSPVLDITFSQQPEIHGLLPEPNYQSADFPKLKSYTGYKDNYMTVGTTSSAKPKYYRIRTYSYLSVTGEKIDLPFKVHGLKNAGPHPIEARLRLYGRKVNWTAPFINVAGSVAQILNLFKR